MGLKYDLIKAKVESFKIQGTPENDIDTSVGSAIEVEAELTKEAIVNFLTQCEFRVTKLNANIVLEDFQTPDQAVNVELNTLMGEWGPVLDTLKKIPGALAIVEPLEDIIKKTIEPLLEGGSTLPGLDLDKDGGGLESTGYVFIGEDPDSQDRFDVSNEDGQREYTTVKLIRDDVEDLL